MIIQKNIVLLGSTGSIGKSALLVIKQNRQYFNLIAIAAGENIQLLCQQIKDFSPELICVKKKKDAESLKLKFPGKKFFYGKQGLLDVIEDDRIDTVINAINGTASLETTLKAIKNDLRICLANKETLVAAGDIISHSLEKSTAQLIPIDSEQSAIFQSIGFNSKEYIKKIILTASGGPFFRKSKDDFARLTITEALAHPTWSMGKKITIDSATLMNKALEIIEAFHLFHLNKDQIDVIIHPQSVIHSMVEFIDSSVIAQLSQPDMRIPILYSLTYPDRISYQDQILNFSSLKTLEFYEVDREKFPSIAMAYYVLEKRANTGAIFNAANEVAVDHFLKKHISFQDIFDIVGEILYNENVYPVYSVDEINETIKETIDKTENLIMRRQS